MRRRRRKARLLLLLLHNLLPISNIIQPVFQMIIWKSGVAALIQQHYTSRRDYGVTTRSQAEAGRAS